MRWVGSRGVLLVVGLLVTVATGVAVAVVAMRWYLSEDDSGVARDVGTDGSRFQFTAVGAASGLHFVHAQGRTGRRLLPETTLGGAGWIDFDRDGLVDLYLVNGNEHPDTGRAGTSSNRLYRNRGDGSFEDVTAAAGVGHRGYGFGLAVGDFDNDGWSDLYVTNLRANVLYRNRGDGTFDDVTVRAGVAGGGWSSSAAFVDVDRDGWLDLYVGRYVEYDPDHSCRDAAGRSAYCSPGEFPGQADLLFLNRGDGRFEEVGVRAGVAIAGPHEGKSLGIVVFDHDDDGDPDIYVACDQVPNLLFSNRGDGTFDEIGLRASVAYSDDGVSQAGMGVDAGDVDLDGLQDLIVTNFSNELDTLYRNSRDGYFRDVSHRFGLGAPTLRPLGFGVVLFDADADADLDLYVGNGHIDDRVAQSHPGMSYAQSDLLLENVGGRQYRDVSATAGDWFSRRTVSRAVATADYDNDGDEDIVVLSAGGPVELLRNDSRGGAWIGLDLRGRRQPDAYGTVVRLEATRDGERLERVRECRAARSFQSSCDPRLHFGLGDGDVRVERVRIRWPQGDVQVVERPEIGKWHEIEQKV